MANSKRYVFITSLLVGGGPVAVRCGNSEAILAFEVVVETVRWRVESEDDFK